MKLFAVVGPILVEPDQHVTLVRIFCCPINGVPSGSGIAFLPSSICCAYELGKGTQHATVNTSFFACDSKYIGSVQLKRAHARVSSVHIFGHSQSHHCSQTDSVMCGD